MKAFLKWTGIILGSVLAFAAITAAVIWLSAGSRLSRAYVVPPQDVNVAADPGVLARGAHLAVIAGCTDCHAENMAGKVVVDDPPLGRVYAPNLTRGEGGAGARLDDDGFVRAIRHGVDADGRSLWIMPSPEYNHLSDVDVAAIVAWIRSLPDIDNPLPARRLGLLGRYLIATGQLPGFVVAAEIDHDAPRQPAPAPGPNAEYGGYLARMCTGCHGTDFAGSTRPGPDGSPPARNLTPAGNLADWTLRDFMSAMRTGVTRSGYVMNPDFMPWRSIGQATDSELRAIFLYLRSLPPAGPGSD